MYIDNPDSCAKVLYLRQEDGSLISFKETSIIEAGHSVSNRVRASIGGVHVSDELTSVVMEHCNMTWNLNRCSDTLRDMQHLGVQDITLLSSVNAAQRRLDGVPSYNVPDINESPVNPYLVEEGQGYAWRGAQGELPNKKKTAYSRRVEGEAASDAMIEKFAAAITKAQEASPGVSHAHQIYKRIIFFAQVFNTPFFCSFRWNLHRL